MLNFCICYFPGKLRDQRNDAIEKFKRLAIAQLIFGVVFLAFVIAQICVAAQGLYGHPLLNVGPWLITIMVGAQSHNKGCLYNDRAPGSGARFETYVRRVLQQDSYSLSFK